MLRLFFGECTKFEKKRYRVLVIRPRRERMTGLLILLVIALARGSWGYGRYGAAGLSPAAITLIVLVILLQTGNLNLKATGASYTEGARLCHSRAHPASPGSSE